MTPSTVPASLPDDFGIQATTALRLARAEAGLHRGDARLLRLYASAVYHLPAAGAVARVAPVTSPASVARRETSLRVTRWLTDQDFPTVEPLPLPQPIVTSGCVVTFWQYVPNEDPPPQPADLGCLLRELHHLPALPVPLPTYQPLTSVRQAITTSRSLNESDRAWLHERCTSLASAYDGLDFALPAGMIHGDAYRGNLLRDDHRVVLADWDSVSIGPREIDLIPTLQAGRFGLPRSEQDAFIDAYGHDITGWDGFPVLRDIRELHTLTALLRNAHTDKAAHHELSRRLTSLKTGDDHRWYAF